MMPEFTVSEMLAVPLPQIFHALVSAAEVENYFVMASSGDLISGTEVTWKLSEYDHYVLQVKQIQVDQSLQLQWTSPEVGYPTDIQIELSALSERLTRIEIKESGWQESDASLEFALLHCAAWQQFLCYLKAYLQYQVSLKN